MCNINLEKLNEYREKIENMNKIHQIEILKILLKYPDIVLSENRNGTFVNLSDLDNSTVNEIDNYIQYYEKQKNQLDILENKKEQLQNEFFNN